MVSGSRHSWLLVVGLKSPPRKDNPSRPASSAITCFSLHILTHSILHSDNEGICDLSGIVPPLNDIKPTYSTGLTHNGPAQMQRFVYADHLNMFRLPVSWQYLTNNSLGGRLNPIHLAHYDLLVQACLRTGAHCQVDLHNYARWNGTVIGEPGGPTNEQFADLWAQIARQYAADDKVWFGVMNEPHDMASAEGWAASVQAAVTAIRLANATRQFISLPGSDWQSAGALPLHGIGEALARVTNPDNSTTGLVFDVHLYLNVNGTGQTAECVTDGVSETWRSLAAWLRMKGRQAIVTETGGGSSTSSCVKYVCQELQYLRCVIHGSLCPPLLNTYVKGLTLILFTSGLARMCFLGTCCGRLDLSGNPTFYPYHPSLVKILGWIRSW